MGWGRALFLADRGNRFAMEGGQGVNCHSQDRAGLLIGLAAMLCLPAGCVHRPPVDSSGPTLFQSTFNNLTDWQDDSASNSPPSYTLTDGILRISTRPGTRDRVKIRTRLRFGAGRYSWRVYVPAMGIGDQASIGAFLYRDDEHEVDFEIGYGKARLRERLRAGEADLVCYCTSQGHPSSSGQILLKREAWYVLSIDIAYGKGGDYLITWLVDGEPVKQLQTDYGDEITFTAHCSVENLTFIGDHIPTRENYGLFDEFEVVSSIQKP